MNHPSCRSNSSKKRRRRRARRLFFETLENRRLLATFIVNSTADLPDSGHVPGTCDTELNPDADPPIPASGICTLRAAVSSANANPGMDTIHFAIPGPGVPTINLTRQLNFNLPQLTIAGGPVVLDATTQGAGTVELRGRVGQVDLSLSLGSNGSTIRGFTINGPGNGIGISDSHNNTIVGNRFGTDSTGTISLPIIGTAIGVFGNHNTIGGTTPEDRNIIASSFVGVSIFSFEGATSTGNVIRGNYIGTDVTGTVAMGHSNTAVKLFFAESTTVEGNVIAASPFGVDIGGSTGTGNVVTGNLIGTDVSGAVTDPDGQAASGDELGNGKAIFVNDAPGVMIVNNVIAGSTGIGAGVDFGYGIQLVNANAGGAEIKGNKIGVNADGNAVLPNKADGVLIESVSNVTIGGTLAADRNIISGNGGDGVTIFGSAADPAMNNHVLGNYIGVDITGELDFGNKFRGVHIDSNAANNIVGGDSPAARNIISGNDSDGVIIALPDATGNVVKGNFIGTDKDGLTAVPNSAHGVRIFHAKANQIGEVVGTVSAGNVISGNRLAGVAIEGEDAEGNILRANAIGTDVSRLVKLPNEQAGVLITDAPRNVIGGSVPRNPLSPTFSGNVIAGNMRQGISITGGLATSNFIGANLIGLDGTGRNPLANLDHGIHITDAAQTRIGVSLPDEPALTGNTIANNVDGIRIEGAGAIGTLIGGNSIGTDWEGMVSDPVSQLGNTLHGVHIRDASETHVGGLVFFGDGQALQLSGNVIAGNLVGVRVIGETALFNKIQRNSIFANAGSGIDLGGDGVSANDDQDGDTGPNQLQNFPVIDRVGLDSILRGTLNSEPNEEFTLDLYKSAAGDPSGNGEGQFWLQAITVTTDANGEADYEIPVTVDRNAPFFTLTATDLAGNTSEFSGPLLQADLTIDPFSFFPQDVVRRGSQFFLPYDITVRNIGTARATDAFFRFRGNDDAIPGAGGMVSLDAGASFTFTGEWEVTSFLQAAPRGAAALELEVTADPQNLIDELSQENNHRSALTSVDARPRFAFLEIVKEFREGYYLAGVELHNEIQVFVDWNGDLNDSQIGNDEIPRVFVRLNGVELPPLGATSLSPFLPTLFRFDLGNQLMLGVNELSILAETRLHGFESETRRFYYDQGNSAPWLGNVVWSVFPQGGPSEKTAEYRTGFFLPQAGTENTTDVAGFYNVPPDRVGAAGGSLGAKIPRAIIRAVVRSDKSSDIQGVLAFESKVSGKQVGGGEVANQLFITLTGKFDFAPTQLDLRELEGALRFQTSVSTPKVPFPPPASFLRGHVNVGAGADFTIGFQDDDQDHLEFKDGVFAVSGVLEGVVSIGVGEVFSLEAGAGGAVRIEFQAPAVPCLTRSASVLLFVRLKAKFLAFEAQKTIRFPFDIAGCGEAGADSAGGEGEQIFEDVFSDIQLAPRYAGPRRLFEGEEGDGLPMITYPDAQPALAENNDGTKTLVYIDEDPSKPDGQHLEVFASTYDGSSWSAPFQLTDDSLLDDSPTIAYDTAGRAVAMWSRLKNPVQDPANVDPKSLLADFEIIYAVRDAATGVWTAPTPLTDNNEMDFLPRLRSDGAGNVTAMWLRDSDNNSPIFPDDTTPLGADYLMSNWDGANWSTPTVAVTNVSANQAPQFDMSGGGGLVAWSEDIDGDITTDTDREIRTSTFDGTNWSAPSTLFGAGDAIADVSPQVVYDSTGRANLVWLRAGVPLSQDDNDLTDQLFFVELAAGVFSTPILAVQANSISEPRLIVDANENPLVVWRGDSEGGPDIFYAVLDRSSATWSKPTQFTDDADLESWFNPFINDDGELEILHLSRDVGSEAVPDDDGSGAEGEPGDLIMVPTFEGSSLRTAAITLGRDLSVVAISLAEENPTPGSNVQVTVTVLNSGGFSTPASTLALRDDGTPVGANLEVPALNAGETVQVVFDWSVPLDALAPHTLVAHVDPDEQLDEIDETNNEASFVVLRPDLVVSSVHTALDNDTITVTVEVLNQGGSPTPGEFDVSLRQNDPDSGAVLAVQTVSSILAPGASTVLTFTIDDALATLGTLQTAFIIADSSDAISELDETNNASFGALDPQRFVLTALPSGAGPFRVRRDVADVVVTQMDAAELIREQLSSNQRLTLPASDQDDQITIDFSGGSPAPSGGIFFSGADGDDTLLLEGGSLGDITFHGGNGQNTLRLLGNDLHLDLTNSIERQLTDVDMIDVRGDGNNRITLNLEIVRDITPAIDELYLLADRGDIVNVGDGWTLTGVEIARGDFYRILEQDDTRLLLAGPADWQNPLDSLDVNNDGSRSPIDALIIINDLNLAQSPFRDSFNASIDPLLLNTDDNPNNDFDEFYRDTNGDGFFSPLDALLIFNFLNSFLGNPEGEGEGGIAALIDSSTGQQSVVEAVRVRHTPELRGATPLVDDRWRRAAMQTTTAQSTSARFARAIDALATMDELYDLFGDDTAGLDY